MNGNDTASTWSDDLDEEDDWDDVDIEHTYLTFHLDDLEYAICVKHVKEIVRLPAFVEVPDVPSFIRGVINLRGHVIPLMDARARLGIRELAYTDRMVAIVLEADGVLTGLVADGVNGVTDFPPDSIDEPPQGGRNDPGRVRAIRGMGRKGDEVSVLLDVGRLLGDVDLDSISTEGAAHP